MSRRPDEIHLRAWRHFITAHALLIDRLNRDLMEAELIPLNWYDVLIELAEAPDHRLRMSDLADNVVLSRSGLTRLVDKLEKAGLLLRESAEQDRRGAFAVITEAGLQALRTAWRVYGAGIEQHFAQYLTDDEAQRFGDALARMIDGLRTGHD